MSRDHDPPQRATVTRGPKCLLALNLGSASLKAASFSLPTVAEGGHLEPVEHGRAAVETPHDADAAIDAGLSLARLAQQLALPCAPDIIAHRIVHGADRPGPVDLTPASLRELQELSSWAPLHQPPALALVQAAIRRWPGARQIGVFDTSWHQTMPERHRIFPIPHELVALGVKRYGFHGLAFQSALRQLGRIAPHLSTGRVILVHLGGGSSLAAVREGRCVNTTMGLTPLGGIAMASRSGSLDPGVLLHLQRAMGMAPGQIDQLLWSRSGLVGLSNESGDMRVLLASGSEGARRAIEVYVSDAVQAIAAMAASAGGLDALVFSGGVGSHAPEIRARIAANLDWLGLRLDFNLNQGGGPQLSAADSIVEAFALEVDEQSELALAVLGHLACDPPETAPFRTDP